MIYALILFISMGLHAQDDEGSAGNVVYPVFGAKKSSCAGLLGEDRIVGPEARRLFAAIVEDVEAQDPTRIHMTLDFTSEIWAWEPIGDTPLRVRFGRDENGRAREAFVTRERFVQTILVRTPEWVEELADVIRRRLPVARVTVVDDLESLRREPWPTKGLVL